LGTGRDAVKCELPAGIGKNRADYANNNDSRDGLVVNAIPDSPRKVAGLCQSTAEKYKD